MSRQMHRRFVESTPNIDIRRAVRELGRDVFAGSAVRLRTGAGACTVSLARCPQPMCGGHRVYFVCGRCERRACILHLYRGAWACRRCHGLAYWSEAIAPRQRRARRLVKLRQRMGQADAGAAIGPLPPKPKRMRWRTYEHLAGQLAKIEGDLWRSPVAPSRLARLMGRGR